MPRGDKSKYTDKQKRQAENIEEGYKKRGVAAKEAESRAWATVNKQSGGGKKSGSGRTGSAANGKKTTTKKSTSSTMKSPMKGSRKSSSGKKSASATRKSTSARSEARVNSDRGNHK
jgi:plasmid stabilization system protein ParE